MIRICGIFAFFFALLSISNIASAQNTTPVYDNIYFEQRMKPESNSSLHKMHYALIDNESARLRYSLPDELSFSNHTYDWVNIQKHMGPLAPPFNPGNSRFKLKTNYLVPAKISRSPF